jgi:organic hydroperoxide reductase OsmC/OhrA
MVNYPIKFEVEAVATEGITTPWEVKNDDLEPIKCCIPTEFNGPGGAYTAEDFFAMSLLNCFIALFKFEADKSKLNFTQIQGKAVVTMDNDLTVNKLTLIDIEIFLDVTGVEDEKKAEEILNYCKDHCPVGNSIKTGKIFHININKK